MATTLRVATLETAFTADTAEVDAAVKRVKGEQTDLTKVPTTVEIDADTADADQKLADVQELLEKVGRTDIDPKVVVDALDAMADLEALADELEQVDRARPEAEIQADIDDAMDRAAKVYDTLQDIDDTVVQPEVDPSGVNDGLKRTEEGFSEFKDEANSTAREGAASFTGEFDDVADIIQETLANAFVGFGPAGAAAGLVAAAGLGVVISKAQEAADRINDAKEEAGDFALEIKDAGAEFDRADLVARFDEMLVKVTDVRSAWELWQSDAVTNLDDISGALDGTEVSLTSLYDAFGRADYSSVERQIELLKEQNELIDAQYKALDPLLDAPAADALAKEWRERERAITSLQTHADTMLEAEENAYQLRAAEEGVTVEQIKQADAIDRVNNALREQHDLEQTSIEAGLDFEDGLAALTEKQEGWNNSLSTGDQMGRDNQRTILGLTDDLQALYDATLEQTGSQEQANAVLATGRQRLLDQAAAAGYNTGQVAALVDQVLEIPLTRGTDVYANVDSAESTLQRFERTWNGRRVSIYFDAKTGTQVTSMGYNMRAMAEGGTVTGGIPGKDSVPILAMPDEEVIAAGPARKHRQLLKAINDDALPRFALGGTVAASTSGPGPAPAALGGVTDAALERFADRVVAGLADRPVRVSVGGREFATAVAEAGAYSERRGGR
ncbi:hypothetical protein [Cellulosimicrobium sp. I38E]|uniref:hypothetical protein n=1 Tax=Cellulosimicrobium sp. I38E TaxID=1393139 RepID=UPI0007B1AC4B|nr:hypothetical protein [Cellulosimicrobium sp. I38E]KZM78404.1 hypothetical protein A0J59_13825 [Cellulosimicrobium sp. I38E]